METEKIERLIRTINQRLRTNKEIVAKRDKSGLSEILFALKMNPSRTVKSPFEKYTGLEPNTIKKLMISRAKLISDNPEFPLTETDFDSSQDSTILIKKRSRGSKLEGSFKKRKGVLMEQSNHIITFLPVGSSQPSVFSKRNIGHKETNEPCCSKEAIKKQMATTDKLPTTSEMSTNNEGQTETSDSITEIAYFPQKKPNQQ